MPTNIQLRTAKLEKLKKEKIEIEFPFLCRYFRENIFTEYNEPFFVLTGNGKTILIFHTNSEMPDYTPINEIDGWCVEIGFELDLKKFKETEEKLKNYYSSNISTK